MSVFVFSVVIVFGVILYQIYANIIRNKNRMDENYANIDVQFKKRVDLLPNILTIAKKFMIHEKNLLEEITELRTSVMALGEKDGNPEAVKQRFELENRLEKGIQKLNISVEDYPELKSQELLLNAQAAYSDVERNLAAARRSYNNAVASLRNSIEIFPGNFMNRMFVRAVPMPMFEVDPEARRDINASDYL